MSALVIILICRKTKVTRMYWKTKKNMVFVEKDASITFSIKT